jgi:mannose-6-phosphate isomerase
VSRRAVSLYPLDGRVQHYAWGSRESLPGFLGRTPDGRPWAEWWLGAHPSAPSTVGSVPATTLDRLVGTDPAQMLGSAVRERFGPRLPFLLKVLAVAEPLSLQVHPTAEQARRGYVAERPVGAIAPEEPLYADEWAKPEMVLALTRFDAFAGLRPPAGVLARLDALAGVTLATSVDRLRADPTAAGVGRLVADLLRLPAEDSRAAVAEVRAGIDQLAQQQAPEAAELAVSARLARRYPDDPAVVVSVLMNHVVLEPGEAMAVQAGLLHCYTGGLAVEIQGTSDNTLRAGLTAKRVDVDEVLRIIDEAAQPRLVWPTEPAPGLETFHPGSDDFALDRICVAPESRFVLSGGVPAVVLAMDGTLTLSTDGAHTELRRGEAVFAPAALGPITLTGLGEVLRARPGTPERDGAVEGAAGASIVNGAR